MTRLNSLRAPARRDLPLVPSRAVYGFLVSLCDQWRARRQLRRDLRQIRYAPEETLRDAGWSRAELVQEIAKPRWRG